MIKPIKIMLLCIVASFLILLVIVYTLLFVLDINDFKPEISAAIKNKIGRDVAFKGILTLDIFPELKLSTGSIVVSNPDGFQGYFMAANDISLRLKPLPLLLKKIDADTVKIQGFKLNLITTPQGTHNWDKLLAKTNDTSTHSSALITGLSINGIIIKNAYINWNNQQTGQHIEVKNLNINTSSIAENIPVTSDFSLLVVDKANQITASIAGKTTLDINNTVDIFTLTGTLLNTTVTSKFFAKKPLTFTLNSPQVLIDKTQQSIKVSDLQLKSADLLITSNMMANLNTPPTLSGKVSIMPFNPSQLLTQLALHLPARRDSNTLNHLDGQFSFYAVGNSIELNLLEVSLDDSIITGSANINTDSKPTVVLNLAVDNIDADRYLPPVNKNTKPIGSATALETMPLEALKKLNSTGRLNIHKLTLKGATMRNIELTLGN